MKRFLKKVIRNTGLEVSSWKNIKPSRQFLVDLIKQRVYKTSLKSPIAKENNLQSSKEKYRIIFDASSFFLEESNFSSKKRTINEAYKEYQKKHFDLEHMVGYLYVLIVLLLHLE